MKNCRTALRIAVGLIAFSALFPFQVRAYPLTLEQRQRLKKYLPRTFPKLEARDPVHVVAIGDSVMLGYAPLSTAWESGNSLFTYPGVFLGKLAREFFYPGGVRLLNPPQGGTDKLSEFLGDEIRFENLSTMNGVMLSGIQRTTTDAFLNKPDLLLIQYGVNDALSHTSLDTFKRALNETILAGKEAKCDMIVFGPPLVNYGGGAMNWGITRPFSSAGKEICDLHGVMFIDLGEHLIEWGGTGVDPDTHPQAAMEIVGDSMMKIFQYGPELEKPEKIHPCLRAEKYLGQMAFDDLLNGPRASDFTISGVASFEGGGEVRVMVSLRNQTGERKDGTIGALAVGEGLIPEVPAQRFVIPPGQQAQVEFRYRRTPVGKSRSGDVLYFPLELDDDVCRFSYVVEDTLSAELLNLPIRIGPVSLAWKSKQFVGISDRIRIEWNLINGTDRPVSGEYQVGMGKAVAGLVNFSAPPLGNKNYFARFEFKGRAGQYKFKDDVWIEVHTGGESIRFDRELEACKDAVLGESIPMSSWADYANAPLAGSIGRGATARPVGTAAVRFEADEKGLRVIASMKGIPIPELGKKPALRATLSIDARPPGEVRDFGFINPIFIYTRGSDGPGLTMPLELGTFGNGYNMILDPRGITSRLQTGEGGQKELTIQIPKTYFHRLKWNPESPDSILGVRLELTPADPNPGSKTVFDKKNSFLTSRAGFNFENKMIRGLSEKDARGLTTLRLTTKPVNTWSVRLY